LNIPERDSIFKLYRIRSFPTINLYGVNLKVDPNAREIQNLLAKRPTGNSSLDALLSNYGLDSFRTSYSYPSFNWIFGYTAQPYNTIQVARELSAYPFINVAEADGYFGDGDRIVLDSIASNTQIDFSIGRGDCPSGCTYRRHWVFDITKLPGDFRA
jgi:hypothetical protein